MPYARQLEKIFARLSSPSDALPRRHLCAARGDFDAVCAAFLQAESGQGAMGEEEVYRAEWNIWAYYFGEHEPFPGIDPASQHDEYDSRRAVSPSHDTVPGVLNQERNWNRNWNNASRASVSQDLDLDLDERHNHGNGSGRPAIRGRDASVHASDGAPRESYLTRIIRERVEKRGRRFLGRQPRLGERERSMSPRSRVRQQRGRSQYARGERDGRERRYQHRYQDQEHDHHQREARGRGGAGGDANRSWESRFEGGEDVFANQPRQARIGGRLRGAEYRHGYGHGIGDRGGGRGGLSAGEERYLERENLQYGLNQDLNRTREQDRGRGRRRGHAFNPRHPLHPQGRAISRERTYAARPSAPLRPLPPPPPPAPVAGDEEPRDAHRHHHRDRAREWVGGWKADTYRPRERENPNGNRRRGGFGSEVGVRSRERDGERNGERDIGDELRGVD
ncbi:hypothetical protein BUE80_DR008054 [Diplocarpon rosae]|nr:hypothetical protein BUE80_DR008054 [Diplocarpon rosae]